jgi:hypothetical protein
MANLIQRIFASAWLPRLRPRRSCVTRPRCILHGHLHRVILDAALA